MRDDDDLHEPEHDHLLDREFFDEDIEPEASALDDIGDERDLDEDDDDFVWLDQPDD